MGAQCRHCGLTTEALQSSWGLFVFGLQCWAACTDSPDQGARVGVAGHKQNSVFGVICVIWPDLLIGGDDLISLLPSHLSWRVYEWHTPLGGALSAVRAQCNYFGFWPW